MKLDEVMPQWTVRERHSTRVNAPPEIIFDAIETVTAREIRFFQTLTWIRRFGRTGRESILNAPADEPILAVATRTGFRRVAVEPPREIVLQLDIAPERIVAAMNFRVDGAVLSTETRVLTRGAKAKLIFGAYWIVIRAGSGFIRRMWLRAIKKRAEMQVESGSAGMAAHEGAPARVTPRSPK